MVPHSSFLPLCAYFDDNSNSEFMRDSSPKQFLRDEQVARLFFSLPSCFPLCVPMAFRQSQCLVKLFISLLIGGTIAVGILLLRVDLHSPFPSPSTFKSTQPSTESES